MIFFIFLIEKKSLRWIDEEKISNDALLKYVKNRLTIFQGHGIRNLYIYF